MSKKRVGQKILNARKAKGLTQSELSEVSSISIRTIQRLESGDVIPRAYTLKTLSEHLGVDLLIESEDSKKKGDKNSTHDLLIKWINKIKNLFNLKTYTMKKIIVLSSVFCLLTIGLFALTKDSKNKKSNSTQSEDLQLNNLKPKDRSAPCGFYGQIVDGDTTYCGLITSDYTDLKEIVPNLGSISNFGYLFDIQHIALKNNQAKQNNFSEKSKPIFNWLGFKLSIPSHNFVDSCRMQFDTTGNYVLGFYNNRKFPSRIGIGGLDEKYFRDHYDFKEVFNKFKNVPNLKVTLNNKLVNKSNYNKLANYEIIEFSDVRSIIVYKDGDDCEIIVKTKDKY